MSNQSSMHFFLARVCALAFLLVASSACSPLVYEPVAAPHDVSLNRRLTPNAAFVFRRPRTGVSVGSSGSAGDWAQFEVGLLRGGINLKDAELLEQLLRDNPSPSYEAIRSRTGADYLIEILSGEVGPKPRPGTDNGACEVATVTVKIVDVRTGSNVGLIEEGMTGCPESCEISRSSGTSKGSCAWSHKNTGGYTVIYPLPGDENRWTMLGGKIATILSSR